MTATHPACRIFAATASPPREAPARPVSCGRPAAAAGGALSTANRQGERPSRRGPAHAERASARFPAGGKPSSHLSPSFGRTQSARRLITSSASGAVAAKNWNYLAKKYPLATDDNGGGLLRMPRPGVRSKNRPL